MTEDEPAKASAPPPPLSAELPPDLLGKSDYWRPTSAEIEECKRQLEESNKERQELHEKQARCLADAFEVFSVGVKDALRALPIVAADVTPDQIADLAWSNLEHLQGVLDQQKCKEYLLDQIPQLVTFEQTPPMHNTEKASEEDKGANDVGG